MANDTATTTLGAMADALMPLNSTDHAFVEQVAQRLHKAGVGLELARTDVALIYMLGRSAGLLAGAREDADAAQAGAGA